MAKSVFISSTSRDLPEYRAAVDKVVRRLELRPVNMDDFGAQPGGARGVSLNQVKKGDIFVGIIAKRYGTVQAGYEKSITEQEYDEAVRLNRPRLMYLVDPAYDWHVDRIEDDETAQRKLATFKTRIEQNEVRSLFTTPEDLAAKVTADIIKLVNREQQQQVITRVLIAIVTITALIVAILFVDPSLRGRAMVIAGLSTATYTPTSSATATQIPTVTPTPTATFTPNTTSTPTITSTPTATFKPSITPTASSTPLEGTPFVDMKDKIGIVLADYEHIDNTNTPDAINTDVERNLEITLRNAGIPFIRVHHFITDDAEAKQIRELYNAAIIIWGQVGAGGVRTFINKVPCTCPGDPDFNSIEVNPVGENGIESYVFYGANLDYITDFVHGQIEYFHGHYDSAIDYFNQAEALVGDKASDLHADLLYYFRGTAWYEKGLYDTANGESDYANAIKDFESALSLNSRRAEAYYGRAKVYRAQKANDLAMADFKTSLDLNPNLVATYKERADFYIDLGQPDKALEDYTAAIKLQPKNGSRYDDRGIFYYNQNKYELAESDFTKAIKLDSTDAYAYENRAKVYYVLTQYTNAIADYTKAIKLDPSIPSYYTDLANLYYTQNLYDQALDNYSNAIKIDPNDAYAYNGRGIVYYFGLKQYDLALEDFTKAVELDPKKAEYINNSGHVYYYILKQYDLALEDFTKAVELDPSKASYYYDLGNVLYDQKKYDLALTNYKHYLVLPDNSDSIHQFVKDRVAALEAQLGTPTPSS